MNNFYVAKPLVSAQHNLSSLLSIHFVLSPRGGYWGEGCLLEIDDPFGDGDWWHWRIE